MESTKTPPRSKLGNKLRNRALRALVREEREEIAAWPRGHASMHDADRDLAREMRLSRALYEEQSAAKRLKVRTVEILISKNKNIVLGIKDANGQFLTPALMSDWLDNGIEPETLKDDPHVEEVRARVAEALYLGSIARTPFQAASYLSARPSRSGKKRRVLDDAAGADRIQRARDDLERWRTKGYDTTGWGADEIHSNRAVIARADLDQATIDALLKSDGDPDTGVITHAKLDWRTMLPADQLAAIDAAAKGDLLLPPRGEDAVSLTQAEVIAKKSTGLADIAEAPIDG